jgi:hypothetical protein
MTASGEIGCRNAGLDSVYMFGTPAAFLDRTARGKL